MRRTKTKTTIYSWLLLLALLPGCFSQRDTKRTEEGLLVVNVLDQKLYDDCHITGSIQVSIDQLDSFADSLNPEKTDVIFYCSNYMCDASGFAVKKLQKRGFKKVAAYEGGTAEWYQKGLPVQGPSKESYLKMVVPKPQHNEDFPIIEMHELAEKMGISYE